MHKTKITCCALAATLCILTRAAADDGTGSPATVQKKGIDLLTATQIRDGKGNVLLIEIKPQDLRERHLHLLCEVTTTQPGTAIKVNGAMPPGMTAIGENGAIVYRGELASFKGDEIEIRAAQPGKSGGFIHAFIPKKAVEYLVFPAK